MQVDMERDSSGICFQPQGNLPVRLAAHDRDNSAHQGMCAFWGHIGYFMLYDNWM
jgi:hypothetical protein